jgi:hypothetical protein
MGLLARVHFLPHNSVYTYEGALDVQRRQLGQPCLEPMLRRGLDIEVASSLHHLLCCDSGQRLVKKKITVYLDVL